MLPRLMLVALLGGKLHRTVPGANDKGACGVRSRHPAARQKGAQQHGGQRKRKPEWAH